MTTENPAIPDFTRDTVLQILRAAFYRCAEADYATGYVIQEEDVRASVYRHTRAALDLVPSWRVFSNLTAYESGQPESSSFKPDLSFFHSADDHATATVEIFAEIKHWPDEGKIERDIQKLLRLRDSFASAPAIAFFAILGHDFQRREAIETEREFAGRFPGVSIWFRHHASLYRGPWDDATGLNPWQRAMRHK